MSSLSESIHLTYWSEARFKDQKVLVRTNAQGEPVVDGGMVEVRYRADAPKVYRGSVKNLQPLEQPGPVLERREAIPGGAGTPEPASSPAKRTNKGNAGRNSRPADGQAATVTPPREGALVIYTDGACTGNPGPAGSGVVVVDGDKITEHWVWLGQATNNVGELTAIQKGLESAPDPERAVDLYTDSDYAIGVLTRGWKAKANAELIANIRCRLKTFKALKIHWIPGHAGVPLNERADELARHAIAQRKSGMRDAQQR